MTNSIARSVKTVAVSAIVGYGSILTISLIDVDARKWTSQNIPTVEASLNAIDSVCVHANRTKNKLNEWNADVKETWGSAKDKMISWTDNIKGIVRPKGLPPIKSSSTKDEKSENANSMVVQPFSEKPTEKNGFTPRIVESSHIQHPLNEPAAVDHITNQSDLDQKMFSNVESISQKMTESRNEKSNEIQNEQTTVSPQQQQSHNEIAPHSVDMRAVIDDFLLKEQQLLGVIERQAIDFSNTLSDRLREQRVAHHEEMGAALQQLEVSLRQKWNEELQARVSAERNKRLARLEYLDGKVQQLKELTQLQNGLLKKHELISRWRLVNDHLKNNDAVVTTKSSLEREIKLLKFLALKVEEEFKLDEPSRVIFDELKSKDNYSLESFEELKNDFAKMESILTQFAFIPAYRDVTIWNFAISFIASKFLFASARNVEAKDENHPLCIIEAASSILNSGDLENTARELNQLKGWPKAIANSWLERSRRRLELLQALNMIESEYLIFSSISQ